MNNSKDIYNTINDDIYTVNSEELPYNPTNDEDILTFAKGLIKKTFRDILTDKIKSIEELENKIKEYSSAKSKGSLGNLIEEYYFYLKNNNISRPDFADADMELKVTPYIKSKNGIKAKERLVLGMISFNEMPAENLDDSIILKKIYKMLLIYYEYVKDVQKLEYVIDYVFLYALYNEEFEEDLEIIRADYKKIATKIREGKAHLLSEADTMYLSACTKASNSKVLRDQIASDIKAKPRAFALKQSYMTYLLNKHINKNLYRDSDNIYSPKKEKKSFNQYVLDLINVYVNKTESELYNIVNIKKNSKQVNNLVIKRLLGVKEEIREFIKGNVLIKTIRVKKNGTPKESMSFPAFKIMNLVTEKFEESEIYNFFSETKFLFIIFMEDSEGEFRLKGAKFWNMPFDDLDIIGRNEWMEVKNKFIKGVNFKIREMGKNVIVKNNLPKKKDTRIFHTRPHADKSAYIINGIKYGNGTENDMDLLPNGDKMTKQCFWLNSDYIKDVIKDIIYKKGGS